MNLLNTNTVAPASKGYHIQRNSILEASHFPPKCVIVLNRSLQKWFTLTADKECWNLMTRIITFIKEFFKTIFQQFCLQSFREYNMLIQPYEQHKLHWTMQHYIIMDIKAFAVSNKSMVIFMHTVQFSVVFIIQISSLCVISSAIVWCCLADWETGSGSPSQLE